MYFLHNNIGYIYIEKYNNIFQITSDLANSLVANEDFDGVENLLKEEFLTIYSENIAKNSIPHEEYYFNNLTREYIQQLKFSIDDSLKKKFIIFELNNQTEIIEDVLFFAEENNNIKILVKENVNNIFNKNTISDLLIKKINYQYYADIHSFENFISLSQNEERFFIELRISHEKDFQKFLELSVPKNIKISLRFENAILATEGFNFIKNKIEEYFRNDNINVSHYFDIVRILKFRFGEVFNIKHYNNITNPTNENTDNCNHCWAKKMCHSTGLYNFFDESPVLTQKSIEKCNSIRFFVKDFFKLLMLFKDIQTQSTFPISLEKKGYKIKIINP